METIVGIDASLTNTAVCIFNRDGTHAMHTFQSQPAKTFETRFRRYQELRKAILDVITWNVPIFLEGYGAGTRGHSAIELSEFGGTLRMELFGVTKHVREVPPATVKQFATEKGNADKTRMALALYKKYQLEFATDDEVDAYFLARLGACALGWHEPTNEAQRKAVATVLGVKIEKQTKRKAS